MSRNDSVFSEKVQSSDASSSSTFRRSGVQPSSGGPTEPSMTTRQRRGTQNADRLAFPPLKKHSTTDHIDTLVLDPHDDHHPLDEHPDEDNHEDDDEGPESASRMLRSGSGSDQTLAEEGHGGTANSVTEGSNRAGRAKAPDLSSAEKGQAVKSAASGVKRPRATTGLSSRQWKDPETREWKDDVS